MTTVIGPVGPEICDPVPPKTAAKNPTAIAPYSPVFGYDLNRSPQHID
jgi:hypothetical protein